MSLSSLFPKLRSAGWRYQTACRKARYAPAARRLRVETLEHRRLLSGAASGVPDAGDDVFYGPEEHVSTVRRTGRTVTVYGSGGDDVFEFTAGEDAYTVVINGEVHELPAAGIDNVVFEAASGHDVAQIRGSSADETVTVYPSSAILTGAGLKVSVNDTAEITVAGGGGSDVAVLHDSSGNDSFTSTPTYAALRGDGFNHRVRLFEQVRAYATGGTDVAKMFDSVGDDLLVTSPVYAGFSGPRFEHEVWHFEGVHAYAVAGGRDLAKHFDSAEDDVFFANPEQGAVYRPGRYYNRAKNFEGVHAYATAGGSDIARFRGREGNDRFHHDVTQSAMFVPGVYYNRAKHFKVNTANVRGGNHDRAVLHDLALADSLEAQDDWALLTRRGQGLRCWVGGFDHVQGFGATSADNVTVSESLDFTLELEGSSLDPPENFNVLFIAVDDLRPELGAYGVSGVHTPNIDQLAEDGLLFNRAYCQEAVCGPSRSSLLTGLRPDSTGIVRNAQARSLREQHPELTTLPQHFKDNDYTVVGMGKIFHGSNDEISWTRYVDVPWVFWTLPESFELQKQEQARRINQAREQGLPVPEFPEGAWDGLPATECADVTDDAYHDGMLGDAAVEQLRRLSRDSTPFFLAAGFIRPHLPFTAPKKYWDLYDRGQFDLAPNPFRPEDGARWSYDVFWQLGRFGDVPREYGLVPEEDARRLIHGYYASVSYVDAQIGRLVDELERLGLRDNTAIVLWGDHGWHLGEHALWGKNTNFEVAARAPLILSVPDVKANGRTTEALTEFVDVYPTLVELCGLPEPEHALQGNSLVPLLGDPNRPWKEAAFSQVFRLVDVTPGQRRSMMGYSMRTDRYRLTVWRDVLDPSKVYDRELYDHRNDPAENVNIAGHPANAALVKRLEEQLQVGLAAALPAPRK